MPVFPLQIRLIAVGKLRNAIWLPAAAEYGQRLQHYAKFEIVEIRDVVGKGLPDETARSEEGKLLAQAIEPGNFLVALVSEGKAFTSEDFAGLLQKQIQAGARKIDFVIGGPVGLDTAVIQKAPLRLSLSAMTLPHELARVVLLEQLYRAFTIIRHEPYHK